MNIIGLYIIVTNTHNSVDDTSLRRVLTAKGPFIAELNSTSSWVELRRYKRALREMDPPVYRPVGLYNFNRM